MHVSKLFFIISLSTISLCFSRCNKSTESDQITGFSSPSSKSAYPDTENEAPPEIEGFTLLGPGSAIDRNLEIELTNYLHVKSGLEFVLIPPGEFVMGSPTSEEGRFSTEGPQRNVQIRSFLLSKTEVSQDVFEKAWPQIEGENVSNWRGGSLPVESVSWEVATSWCEEMGLRLPTESEWEYACRAGTASRFSFGDKDIHLGSYAWYNNNSSNQTHAVGVKPPNAFGLFDMHGNVAEWCSDAWYGSHIGAPVDGSPRLSDSRFKVVRGGSWCHHSDRLRSADRMRSRSYSRLDFVGFRPACSLGK